MEPRKLEAHLRVMNDLRTQGGRISRDVAKWLMHEAKASGRDPKEALQAIRRVNSIQDPEQRARAYVIASGAPSNELVNHALGLSSIYSTEWASTLVNDRLAAKDQLTSKAGTYYQFEDTDRIKAARQESSAVRRTIEATLREKGLVPPKARTLEEAQNHAKAYANFAADKMESTNPGAPLRDHIEDAWRADQGIQKLNDAGLSGETMGSVIERADATNFAARAFDES